MLTGKAIQPGDAYHTADDYSLTGLLGNKNGYAIVSSGDGSFSINNSDCGTRLLSILTKQIISAGGNCMSSDLFTQLIIFKIKELVKLTGIDPRCFDASLSSLWTNERTFSVNIYGNGMFFHKNDTCLRIVDIDSGIEKPGYISYNLSEDRMVEFLKRAKKRQCIDTTYDLRSNRIASTKTSNLNPLEKFSTTGNISSGSIIGVATSGMSRFYKGEVRINSHNLLRDFLELDNFLLQMRMSKMKIKWASSGIYHPNDIAIGAIKI